MSYSVGQSLILQENNLNHASHQQQSQQQQSLIMSNVRQIDDNIYSTTTPNLNSNILLQHNSINQLEQRSNIIPSTWDSVSQSSIIIDEHQQFEQNHFTKLSACL